ncbi:Asp23/Gls24 family envelope stress response protein [Nocardia blacklockiae]|uniref:Asp23/Gls24 family envelope stress response protein n=1 Tax=Nocardia blacklockiae TaxID=480036 RepID=UPI0018954525|nr:Asp23/Gls24 family envelope stress response protein [Nocardia blacklockiae]MBF6174866.1 Asp23/Gls24 family envelope stress response protein [Nocardia blacklockiae]
MTAAAAEPPAAELRGVTVVGERAVRRIATRAAREVAGVEPDVQVIARVAGDTAVLRVRLPVRYPLPVGRVTDACRAHLIERTRELSGLAVPRVDIEVSALPTAAEHGRVR